MPFLSTVKSILTFGASENGHAPEVRAAQYGDVMLPVWRQNKPVWPERSLETYTTEYGKLALLFRLVGIVSQAVGAAPLMVYTEDREGGREPQPRHPMRALMQRPNPQMRESRFMAHIAMLATVTGFALVEKERSAAGRTVALWPLRSDWARPIPRTGLPPDWEYRVPGREPVEIPADDLLHITYADRPDGSPYGIGALEVALREIGLLNVMTDFLKGFFDHGAQPQLGLIPREAARVTQAEADALKETWRRRAGLLNSIDPAILVGIEKIERLGFDFNELAFDKLRSISDVALCQAFGVPPGLVGTQIGMERNTYSNAQEMRRSFYEDTISPFWARLDDAFTLGLLPEFDAAPTTSVQFDPSDIPALQEDRNAKFAALNPVFLGGGIPASVYCAELNLPAPTKDFYLRGMTQDAIPADDPLNKRQPPKPIATVQPPLSLPATTDDEDEDDETERIARAIIREYRGRMGPAERRVSVAIINRRTVQRIAEAANVWIRSFFTGQQSRAVATTGTLDWQTENALLGRDISRLYDLSGATAYGQIGEQIGVSLDWDLANPNLDDVRSMLAQRVTGINDVTRADIQRIVTEALNEGVGLEDLRGRLEGLYEETYNGRSMTIARTESQVAFNTASSVGYRESGVVDRLQLFDNPLHSDDYGASDGLSCAARNGLVVPLDDAQKHINAEHPNGTLAVAGVLIGEEV